MTLRPSRADNEDIKLVFKSPRAAVGTIQKTFKRVLALANSYGVEYSP